MRWVVLILYLLPGLVSAQAACPSSFQQFLSKFEADRVFQQQHTVYPLKHSFVDLDADPEPRVVAKPLSKADVISGKNPLYPSQAHQKEVHLEKKVEFKSKTLVAVQLQKPGTGYMLIYRFKSIAGCWKLVEFEDAST